MSEARTDECVAQHWKETLVQIPRTPDHTQRSARVIRGEPVTIMMDISEAPTPIRSKTWSFYVVLLVAVLPLWSSVPLAWIFTAHSLIAGSFSILFYLALGEVSGHPPFDIYSYSY
jgi:hypothetical protein